MDVSPREGQSGQFVVAPTRTFLGPGGKSKDMVGGFWVSDVGDRAGNGSHLPDSEHHLVQQPQCIGAQVSHDLALENSH